MVQIQHGQVCFAFSAILPYNFETAWLVVHHSSLPVPLVVVAVQLVRRETDVSDIGCNTG